MYQISKDELEQIKGGGISAGWVVAGISAIVVFVTGLIDGIVHPNSCAE